MTRNCERNGGFRLGWASRCVFRRHYTLWTRWTIRQIAVMAWTVSKQWREWRGETVRLSWTSDHCPIECIPGATVCAGSVGGGYQQDAKTWNFLVTARDCSLLWVNCKPYEWPFGSDSSLSNGHSIFRLMHRLNRDGLDYATQFVSQAAISEN